MNNLIVGPKTEITLYFSLELEDDSIVDSNFGSKPATFNFGDGSLLPGFEKKLEGLTAGDERVFTILPEQGFGQTNPNNIQVMEPNVFDSSLTLSEGLVLSFADAAGAERPGIVKSFTDKEVIIDFNHPLAGKTIQFEVKIISVNESLNAE